MKSIPMKAGQNARVPLGIKLGYGVADLGGNLFFTLIGFYLTIYLTDGVQLAAHLTGWVVMIGSFWDAMTDPLVGIWSDRCRTGWGRRRPFMFWGAISLFLTMVLMFNPWQLGNQNLLFLLMTLIYCLLNTAYTLYSVPYSSLLPELTGDFDQRTVMTGYRMTFAVIGTLVGVGLAPLVLNSFEDPIVGWPVMGGVMGLIMLTTILITTFSIKEPSSSVLNKQDNFMKTMRYALTNKAFLLALFPWTFHIAGITLVQGAIIYYFKYIYLDEESFQFALLALLLASLVFIPVWVQVAARIGKKWTYNIGMTIVGLGVLAFYFFAESGGVQMAIIIMGICGVGFSTHYVIPFALVPDVIECDFAETGIRREGAYFSLWTFMSKLGRGIAMGMIGWVLAFFHYSPEGEQPDSAIFGIKLLCGPIPMLFFVAGVLILHFYPISKDYYLARTKPNST